MPASGFRAAEIARLRRTLTHVVHCAASVAFDDSYESSFRANVIGSRNALAFSLDLQRAPRLAFRRPRRGRDLLRPRPAAPRRPREDRLAFPAHFYNNFYELTKAMAAIETERTMLERRPARRAAPAVDRDRRRPHRQQPRRHQGRERARQRLRAGEAGAGGGSPPGPGRSACGPPWWASSAPASPPTRPRELNLVTVDRVAAGVLAALTEPQAIGARIHLATDHRIRSEQIARVMREELEIDVRLADPTLTRVVTLPLARAVLVAVGEPKLGQALERLGAIFGVYVRVGTDRPRGGRRREAPGPARPAPGHAWAPSGCCAGTTATCRSSARCGTPEEIARRERLWERAIDDIEFGTGPAGRVAAGARVPWPARGPHRSRPVPGAPRLMRRVMPTGRRRTT